MVHQPMPNYFVDRFNVWRSRKFEDSKAWYARLMSGGQHPRAMLIACCDSRLDMLAMFGAEPGDLFMVRNVANLVPPYTRSLDNHSTSAAVEYAVTVLKVAHIVVVGHSDCGGVAACHDMCSGAAPALKEKTSFIGQWMNILRPGYERIEVDGVERRASLRSLEHEAVKISLQNLSTFPFVQEALNEGVLSIHGGWIDIAQGRMYGLKGDRFEML